MPVKVYSTASGIVGKYDSGMKVHVEDGHLVVSDGARVIAIYAPGSWHHSEVTRKADR